MCAVIAAVVFFAQSFTMSLPYFLVCGFLMGLTIPTLMYLATPVLVNRWFTKRAGFFVGLAMAFTGIGGVVFNPIGTAVITSFGWEMAYRAFAVIALVLTLPFSLFVVRSNPSDKGLLPFGAEEVAAKDSAAPAAAVSGMRAEEAFRSKELILAFVWGLLVNLCMYAYTVTATYVGEMQIAGVTDAVAFAGIAASVVMAGQTIGKVVFGGIGDKSPQLCVILGLGAGVIGLLTYQFVPATQPSIFIAAFLVGLFASVATVAPPIVARRLFGTLDYSRIWGRLSMATTIGGMVMALIWGTLRTVTGGWAAMFITEAIILACCIVLGLIVIGFAPRLRKRWVTQDASETPAK